MHCKDCKFWKPNKKATSGECDKIDYLSRPKRSNEIEEPKINEAGLYVDASDDTGIVGELHTGAEFGCIQFVADPLSLKNF